jgi:hypothetical protein
VAPDAFLAALRAAHILGEDWNSQRIMVGLEQRLAEIVESLPASALSSIWTAAETAENSWMTRHLSSLVPYLPADKLLAAWTMWATGRTGELRVLVPNDLRLLAPKLPKELLPAVLHATHALVDERSRADALAALVPYLSVEQLRTAVDDARAMNSGDLRSEVMSAIAEALSSHSDQVGYSSGVITVADLLENLTREHALEILAAAARWVAVQEGGEGVLACCDAVIDVCDWWP